MARDRRLNDWLSAYLEYVDHTEPPLSYHVWTGLSTIAAALQRKVWVDWNRVQIFPNMYIVLVGPSGRCKKGTAMNLGRSILRKLDTVKFTANSTTRESVIQTMSESEQNFVNPDRSKGSEALDYHSSLTIFSDELSVFLGQNNIGFLANLTDWYDSHDLWVYKTKARGEETIKGVCLNLLGGTAPDWFQSILPDEAIGGGFTSRIFFIVEERKRKTVVQHNLTQRERKLEAYLIEDLERINNMRGAYEFTEGALELYSSWYEDQDDKMNKGIFAVNDPRFAGYCDRRATHIKKLGMIMAASRSSNLVIDVDDFERARDVMEKAEVNMSRAFSGLGQSDYARLTAKIISFFQNTIGMSNRSISREALLIQYYRDMDLPTWEIIKSQLEAMRYIKIILNTATGEESYIWTGPNP